MSNSKAVKLVIEPHVKDLGEFTVRRSLPDRRRQRIGPFIFFDHMGPAVFPPGTGVNVRSHPHIGLATITWLFEGEILHRDSLGFVQAIQPGAVNWMTAGKGIVHSEKVRPEIFDSGQKMHGIQTWVALPGEAESIEPRFEHYPADAIPTTTVDGVELTIIIGAAYGSISPVQTESETLYVEANIPADRTLALPDAQELGVYIVEGSASIEEQVLEAGRLAIIATHCDARVTALGDCKLMLCGGDALDGERHIWWNFVSSSRATLQQAKNDWRDGNFDDVPGESDFIPLPSI
jgi:redox-sensitive bicupin YhaK (pirin superfamily)